MVQQDSQVFTMSQPKRSRRKKKEVAPPPESDSSEDEANDQVFSISNGGADISHRGQLFMLPETLNDADEVQELIFKILQEFASQLACRLKRGKK